MEDHVLVIHIGTPKTGTTSLQSFLHKNNEVLKQYGWCYPDINNDLESVVSCYREGVNGLIFYEDVNLFNIHSKHWDYIWGYLKDEKQLIGLGLVKGINYMVAHEFLY